MTDVPEWKPGDSPILPNGEEWIWEDILKGNAESLAEFLEAGHIPSAAMCLELASFIRTRRLVAVEYRPPPQTDFAKAKDIRDRNLGAWVWARRICIEGETLDSAIAEALEVRAWPFSAATIRRASADFRRRISGDWEESFWAGLAMRGAVVSLCEESGLDQAEMLSRIEPAQKLRAFFETGN